jgi:hypothetical protein
MPQNSTPNPWLKVAEIAAPLVTGLFAGHQSKKAANQASQGARLQDLLPQIQALIGQQQQHSAENYAAQQAKYAQTQPLAAGILQNATNLLPHGAKSAMPAIAPPPASAAPSALPMPSVTDLTAGVQRRGGGTGGGAKGAATGAMTGAGLASVLPGIGTLAGGLVGGLTGGIKGLLTKHASTAPTDFALEDAKHVLTQAYQQYFGRVPEPGVIERAIQGQGWQPGDRWVGEGGLSSILRAWQGQAGH